MVSDSLLGGSCGQFGGQSVLNRNQLGAIFEAFRGQAAFSPSRVSCTRNTCFHRFKGSVSDTNGNLFQELFYDGLWDIIVLFFCRSGAKSAPPVGTFGDHFAYNFQAQSSKVPRGLRVTRLVCKTTSQGGSLKLLS